MKTASSYKALRKVNLMKNMLPRSDSLKFAHYHTMYIAADHTRQGLYFEQITAEFDQTRIYG